MTSLGLQVRRATLDDMPSLRQLWELMRFSVPELEKQLTDFQVVLDATGVVVGAVAFQMAQRHGRIHSESFGDFSFAEQARPLLWNRINALCTNHGVLRIWTEEQAPFYPQSGFVAPTPTALEKLPEAWGRSKPNWLTLQLRDESVAATLDKEFAMFVAAEKQRSAQAIGQAKLFRTIATVLAVLIAIGIFAAALYIFISRRAGGSLPH